MCGRMISRTCYLGDGGYWSQIIDFLVGGLGLGLFCLFGEGGFLGVLCKVDLGILLEIC